MITEAREIVITIKSDSTATASSTSAGEKQTTTSAKESGQSQKSLIASSVLANQVFSYAKKAVISQATYQVNRYFDMTDDYNGRQDVNNAMTVIGIGMNIVGSTVAGAQVGGIVGAIVGLVGSVGNTLLQGYQAMDTQNYHIRQSNAQLSYTMSRRGASLQNNSIGENL